MLSKCANPACAASFRYLREGKVFIADWVGGEVESTSGTACLRRTEMFWLCSKCSQQLTLAKAGNSVIPVARGKRPESVGPPLREVRIYG